jgi:hypothetical protein
VTAKGDPVEKAMRVGRSSMKVTSIKIVEADETDVEGLRDVPYFILLKLQSNGSVAAKAALIKYHKNQFQKNKLFN